MSKLEALLDMFRNDTTWNTPEVNGGHRFDKKIAWIETMIRDYAEKFNMSTDEVTEIMERERTYSWPNYYQEANFPSLDSDCIIGIYETMDDFHEKGMAAWKGFKCPKCGDITPYPQECIHRKQKDGKCDWCAYGFLKSNRGIIIKSEGLELIPIFEPVEKDLADKAS